MAFETSVPMVISLESKTSVLPRLLPDKWTKTAFKRSSLKNRNSSPQNICDLAVITLVFQNANKRQIPVFIIVIQSVPHNKLIAYIETAIFRLNVASPPA